MPIADDQALVRAWTAALLDLEPDITCGGPGSGMRRGGRSCRAPPCGRGPAGHRDAGLTGRRPPSGSSPRGTVAPPDGHHVLTAPGHPRASTPGRPGSWSRTPPRRSSRRPSGRRTPGCGVVDRALAEKSLLAGPNPRDPAEQDAVRGVPRKPRRQIGRALHLSRRTARRPVLGDRQDRAPPTVLEAAAVAARNGWL
ncbi:DNA-binding response regulator [Kocuria rhizophila]|nr:DNA-binding response regulator [Kocuria rhizophila]